jgi:NADH-quinone oxidoreductase subunit M
LPEAHVEAPTAGSIVLASLLLKLGGYGFLRIMLPIFPAASLYFTPLVYTLSILSIIYASLTAIRQFDLKKIIAYSSVAHMNLVVLGIFSFKSIGILGAIFLMGGKGIVSGALF